MRYLKQNTDQYVTVGPFIDKSDGFTTKDDLTVTNISYVLSVSTHASASTHSSGSCSATASASWGMAGIGHGGMYDCKIPAADINFVGSCTVCLYYATSYLPVFMEFQVVPANIWDSLMGTDKLDVNAAEHGGTTQTGRDIGASVLLSSGTGTGQVSLTSGTVTVGTNNDKTGYTASTVSDKTGYSLAADQAVNVTKWNGSAVATPDTAGYPKVTIKSGTGTGELSLSSGAVLLQATQTGVTIPTVTTVGSVTTDIGKYAHGAVWIDTVNGASGTASYTNGIPSNPCSTLAAAKTIADNLKLKRFWIQAGSNITLAASYAGYVFDGRGYIMALGGQDISQAQIERVEGLSGTAICTSGEAVVYDSHLNAITIGEVDFNRCHLNNTVTLSQASVPYLFHHCAGIGTAAKITFAAASQSAVVAKWSGNLTIAGMVSTNTLFLDGDGDVTIDATNTAGTVYISGNIRLTNNGSGQTIYDTSRWAEDQNVTNVTGSVATKTGYTLTSDYDAAKTASSQTSVNTIDTVVDLIEDILRNKMTVNDTTGDLVLYADDNSTPLYTVSTCITDNGTITVRKRLE